MGRGRQGQASFMGVSENDAITDETAFSRQAVKGVNNTGSDFIDGVIYGTAWKGGAISYAFPNNKADYGRNYGNGEPNHNFGAVGTKIREAAQFTLDKDYGGKANDGFALEGFTQLRVSKGSDSNATIRYAESSSANPTAYGYYPNSGATGGDIWFGTSHDYNNAVSGNYNFATVIHETGHALGLKHGHESYVGHPAIPSQWDSLEYSVMTYRSFVGDDINGYNNEPFGFPQTFMMADIAALQHMYGANFDVNDNNTVYKWTPNNGNTYVNGGVGIHPGANRIFATIWDGGGKDTYNLSAYSNNLNLDLRPGAYSVFSGSQRADLDWSSNSIARVADGNIYNALLYRGDTRSLIENAVGGSGNDKFTGNTGNNYLNGRSGNDTFFGYQGNDTYNGGGGADTFVFRTGWDRDSIANFDGTDRINLASFDFASVAEALMHAANDGKDVVFNFGNGDTLRVENTHKGDFQNNDFVI